VIGEGKDDQVFLVLLITRPMSTTVRRLQANINKGVQNAAIKKTFDSLGPQFRSCDTFHK
jgi:hypothetical protein